MQVGVFRAPTDAPRRHQNRRMVNTVRVQVAGMGLPPDGEGVGVANEGDAVALAWGGA
jgi:hypothetical protein